MTPLEIDADLPPSARHVAHVLQEQGPLTREQLVEYTTLPETTVDDALQRLVEEDIATPTRRLIDARGRRYELTG